MRILAADDDFISRLMLTAVLKKWVTAENEVQAWEILHKADAPKLPLLDWTMPEMDGLEVIRRVRGQSSAGTGVHYHPYCQRGQT